MKHENLFRTGRALATVKAPAGYPAFDFDLLCKNIGECVPGSNAFSLNAVAFGSDVGTPSADRLEDVLGRAGIRLNWDAIGRTPGMKDLLAVRTVRDAAKEAKNFLKWFSRVRNEAAHSGSGGTSVTDSELEKSISYFGLFAESLTDQVEAQLGVS